MLTRSEDHDESTFLTKLQTTSQIQKIANLTATWIQW